MVRGLKVWIVTASSPDEAIERETRIGNRLTVSHALVRQLRGENEKTARGITVFGSREETKRRPGRQGDEQD